MARSVTSEKKRVKRAPQTGLKRLDCPVPPYIQTKSGVDMGQPGRGRARPLRRNEQFDPNKA